MVLNSVTHSRTPSPKSRCRLAAPKSIVTCRVRNEKKQVLARSHRLSLSLSLCGSYSHCIQQFELRCRAKRVAFTFEQRDSLFPRFGCYIITVSLHRAAVHFVTFQTGYFRWLRGSKKRRGSAMVTCGTARKAERCCSGSKAPRRSTSVTCCGGTDHTHSQADQMIAPTG